MYVRFGSTSKVPARRKCSCILGPEKMHSWNLSPGSVHRNWDRTMPGRSGPGNLLGPAPYLPIAPGSRPLLAPPAATLLIVERVAGQTGAKWIVRLSAVSRLFCVYCCSLFQETRVVRKIRNLFQRSKYLRNFVYIDKCKRDNLQASCKIKCGSPWLKTSC